MFKWCFLGTLLLSRCCLNFKRPTSNVFFEELVLGNLIACLYWTIFYAWWMAQGEVCNLESLGLLLMSFDVPERMFCESFPFEHCMWYVILWYFCREFDIRVEIVSLFNELIYLFSVAIPKGENIINVTFPFFWFGLVLICWINFFSISGMKIMGNGTVIFIPKAVPNFWRKLSSVN